MVKVINEALNFFIELAMLAAFSYAGFHWGNNVLLHCVSGIGIPVLVIIFWAKKMAPKATHQIPPPMLWIVSLLLFEAAAAALYLTGATRWGILLAVIAFINIAMKFLFGKKANENNT